MKKSEKIPKKKTTNEENAKAEVEMPRTRRETSTILNRTPKKIPVGQNFINPKSIKKKQTLKPIKIKKTPSKGKKMPNTQPRGVQDIREFFLRSGTQSNHPATANMPAPKLAQSKEKISSSQLTQSPAGNKTTGKQEGSIQCDAKVSTGLGVHLGQQPKIKSHYIHPEDYHPTNQGFKPA